MRVINNAHKATIYNLGDGTVFCYSGEHYIKTDEYDSSLQMCTCVRLIDGKLVHIGGSMVVEFYEAEVTLK